ncbi:MAG: toll/interleukin-1 receptor domain-containing protein [Lachnospiraceae bacterium]|nr:toll/interleukin-1 receptor domain-containing protein [Lachnospiraceae bacterium]
MCKFCGATNFFSANSSKYANQLNRANKLRQEKEFDNAARIYDTILDENAPTADILWLRTLCEYGIEYVPDPVSDKYFPTLHRINDESILNFGMFKRAIELSDDKQKETLLKEAKYIDTVQTKYLNIAANEDPYDVFICYKETDLETGEKTEDVKLAEELYNELTNMGYKVFFARETLKEKISVEYEPYIFAALKSAKVMAVIGTKAEYFTAVWVKNEWGRFLKLMEKNPGKQMFFACDDPEELPRAFATKQAQILGVEGAIKNLASNIRKFFKEGSSYNKKDGSRLMGQEEFDQIIEKEAKEYSKNLDKTQFGDKERSIRESVWKLFGYMELKNKVDNRTFHIGTILLIASNLTYIICAISMVLNYIKSDYLDFGKPSFLATMIFVILFILGILILSISKYVFNILKEGNEEIVLYIAATGMSILIVGFIYTAFVYETLFLQGMMLVLIPIAILVGGPLKAFCVYLYENKSVMDAEKYIDDLNNLEVRAKKEFLDFVSQKRDNLVRREEVSDEVEIKDEYFELVKPFVLSKISSDKNYIWKKSDEVTSLSKRMWKRMIFTGIYLAIALTISVINIAILSFI